MSDKFRTMADMRRGQAEGDGKKDGKKAGATSFVGSGQNVIGRPSPTDDDEDDEQGGGGSHDVIDRIFQQQGVGPDDAGRVAAVITFYRNGFTVNDGELRKMDDPANKAFLEDINNGRVPRELLIGTRAADLDVSVNDKRSEDYVAPPYRAFGGAGTTIGRASAPPSAVVRNGGGARGPPVVDPAAPTTTIAVRLLSGKREKVVLNLTHTVGDLQAVVAGFGGPGGPAFVLHTGFPPKPLQDSAATIEAAGLKGAAVTQVAA